MSICTFNIILPTYNLADVSIYAFYKTETKILTEGLQSGRQLRDWRPIHLTCTGRPPPSDQYPPRGSRYSGEGVCGRLTTGRRCSRRPLPVSKSRENHRLAG